MSDPGTELRNKGLTSVPSSFIDNNAKNLTNLDLTDNQLNDLSFLSKFSAIETLILDGNGLASLSSMPRSGTVDTLWLNRNKISDLRGAADAIVRCFPNLTYLSLLKNPCTPDMYFSDDEGEAYQRYRYYMIYRLPRLEMLDATEVDADERKKALQVGEMMAPARPTEEADTPVQAYSVKQVLESNKETKTSTYLIKSKPRYDGSNSEGNRFITNDDL